MLNSQAVRSISKQVSKKTYKVPSILMKAVSHDFLFAMMLYHASDVSLFPDRPTLSTTASNKVIDLPNVDIMLMAVRLCLVGLVLRR